MPMYNDYELKYRFQDLLTAQYENRVKEMGLNPADQEDRELIEKNSKLSPPSMELVEIAIPKIRDRMNEYGLDIQNEEDCKAFLSGNDIDFMRAKDLIEINPK